MRKSWPLINSFLSDEQHGFRRGLLTSRNLAVFSNLVNFNSNSNVDIPTFHKHLKSLIIPILLVASSLFAWTILRQIYLMLRLVSRKEVISVQFIYIFINEINFIQFETLLSVKSLYVSLVKPTWNTVASVGILHLLLILSKSKKFRKIVHVFCF